MKMNKCIYKKITSYILTLMLVVTYSTGISFADTNITYDNSKNLIEKLSHPTTGEGIADGILPVEGDRANSYSWALTQLGDYVYIGSNRNILTSTMVTYSADYGIDPNLFLKFMDDISNGDIPTDDLADYQGRMFRYDMNKNTFEQVYMSPYTAGYRGAITFTPAGTTQPRAYFGTVGAKAQVLAFDTDFEAGDSPEVVFDAETGYASIRAMTQYEDSLCIGVLTVEATEGAGGNLQVLQSTNPAIDNWKVIGSIDDFAPCDPRTDDEAAAQSGVWDMVTYNGSIYAFIGTGYDYGSETSGYSVFKGTYLPEDENANGAGWVWKMIVGPLTDGNGEPTGAQYPRGMGNPYDGSASPFLFTDPTGETYVYVGTFDSIFDGLFDIFSGSYESLYLAMHPAKVYRFDKNDNWEMVIGNPDKYFDNKIGNYYAGFSNSTEASVYSPNMYVWRMAEYNGELFTGTFDGTTLLGLCRSAVRH